MSGVGAKAPTTYGPASLNVWNEVELVIAGEAGGRSWSIWKLADTKSYTRTYQTIKIESWQPEWNEHSIRVMRLTRDGWAELFRRDYTTLADVSAREAQALEDAKRVLA